MTAKEEYPPVSIQAEASEWFVNFREGDVDVAGQLLFSAWLKKSPEHIRAYMEVAALWSDIPQLSADLEIDADAVVAYARSQGNVSSIRPNSNMRATEATRAPRRRYWAALAASIAACSVLLVWWQLSRAPLYETGIAEQRLITLSDGSTVELTARSQVRVRMTKSERHIELLAGQALFRVTKDASRPFIVVSDDVSVRAVGTQFDVHRRTSGTVVTVLEGRVAVASNAVTMVSSAPATAPAPASLYLSAGEQITMPDVGAGGSAPVLQARHVDPTQIATWAERTLNFDNEALADVVEEFNRYNQRQIVLADDSLSNLRISGVFSAKKPASLLRFLDEQMQLQVAADDTEVRIERRHQ
ncbi:FecR family protein [Steroidobacter sp.]|uniref:FecR family protein n=1 Tax=Steroidobacter sp. TaxID=1978227 RepID=UPI001A49F295|nr:FecR domain-containing protein [Steroidobacter sp.]MBL8270001.1 FecR domain-containing protein [Steroidobacter sp.]